MSELDEIHRDMLKMTNDWKPPEELCRIVCAAVLLEDGTIIPSPRHYDPTTRALMKKMGYDPSGRYGEREQGFIDQWGRFWNRTDAWKIAERQGQIRHRCGGDSTDGGTLYSENLY